MLSSMVGSSGVLGLFVAQYQFRNPSANRESEGERE